MKSQLLLCGTQYGQVYLPAIFESQQFELAALLAKGSARSQKISQQCGVTLYADVKTIDEPIDLAVVAIGIEVGAIIANDLLAKSIPVLIEHPVSAADLDLLLSNATKNQTYCHINSHFSHIAPIADFIKLCQQLNNSSRAYIITVNCNSRTLFSTLDILMRAFGVFAVSNFNAHSINASGSYQQCSFLLQGIPCNMVYQRWRSKVDNSKDSPLGHQITATYPEGVLSLAGTFGPCLWFPLIAAEIPPQVPLFSALQQNAAPPTQVDMIRWRKIANHKSLLDLWNAKCNAIQPEYQSHEFLTKLCNNWSLLFNRLSVDIQEYTPQAIDERFWMANSILDI